MAKKISALTAAGALTGAEEFPLNQAGTKKGTINQVRAGLVEVEPDDANFRVKEGNTFQLRETAPTPGWRSLWLVNGVLTLGELETE